MLNRRNFLVGCSSAAALGATSFIGARTPCHGSELASSEIAVFAKPLQTLPFDELARRLASIDVHGIEATLRKGGQIEPSEISHRLGSLCDALAQHKQRVIIAASDVNRVDENAENYLKCLTEHDIKYFRMNYYRYNLSQPILPQLDGFARQAQELADFCASLGITALYQNHAGRQYVGAALWDLYQVLNGIDSKHLAVAFDIRHSALELSESWPAAYSVIRPHIGAVFVKDVAWIRNQYADVPLGQGVSKPVWDKLKNDGLPGPFSLHMEHMDHTDDALIEQRWEATRKDVETLQSWLKDDERN